jgi:glycosyltransferase involved in cell wall biosynthesis
VSARTQQARAARHEGQTALEVSVVIPCLNEAQTLGACIDVAQRALREAGVAGEVVVADNGSTDGSDRIAEEHGARVVQVPDPGYGSALRGGIAAAQGEYVLMGDADGSYDFGDLGVFLEQLRAGNDLVVGNRFRGGIERGAMPFLHEYLGNPVLSRLGRRFFRTPCGDIYCGLRAFRREAITGLGLTATGMEYAIEMVVKASLYGLRVTEVPTTLSPDGRDRKPHLRTWRDGWRSLRFLLLYSPGWLFLYPGLVLTAVGLAVMVWLIPGQRTVGSVTFDVHTLLYAGLAVILGLQAVLFWLFARVFAVSVGLLPPDPRLERWTRAISLEIGLLVGGLCFLGGLGGSIYAVLWWGNRSFGQLDYSSTLRLVIPSATLLAVGFELLLGSFFLSILGMKRR